MEKNHYKPQIFDFKRLFGGSERPGQKWGFPAGSSILISGAPGAGKTTFALALARGVLFTHTVLAEQKENPPEYPQSKRPGSEDSDRKWGTIAVYSAGRPGSIGKGTPTHTSDEADKGVEPRSTTAASASTQKENSSPSPAGLNQKHQHPPSAEGTGERLEDIRVYYVSNENDRARLEDAFSATGWFEPGDPLFDGNGSDKFHLIGRPIDTSRPPLSSEELINSLTHELRQLHAQSDNAKAIIIVDSLSSLLRDCRDRGEERRQSHEFMHRLETAVGREHLALVFFLSEETSSADSSTVLIEEYVVHFVFRLRLKDTGLGRRLRTLEVVKSHGVPLHIGEHTWSIITSGHSVENVLSLKELQDHVSDLATRKVAELNAPPSDQNLREWSETGIAGLDEMLDFGSPPGNEEKFTGQKYWIYRELDVSHDDTLARNGGRIQGLRADSTTVLIGPSGTGKMTMCRQFLEAGVEGNNRPCVLYISSEHNREDITGFLSAGSSPKLNDDNLFTIFRRRGNLDVNALLAEIRFAVRRRGVRRVVIDGLSSLMAGRSPEDSTRLIENLIFTFKDISSRMRNAEGKPHPIALFLTYEPETILTGAPSRDAMEAMANHVPRLAAFSDNIIILRPVVINDQLRQSIYIAKAKDLDHDRTVREVYRSIDKKTRLPIVTIEPGLEAFTGLFSPDTVPERVQLVLQLFQENRSERKYNRWLRKHLRNSFGYDIELFAFTRDAITSTLDEFASTTSRVPDSNLKVSSLDEWEVRDSARQLLHLSPFEGPSETRTSLAKESDFWAWEIGKVKLPDDTANAVAEPKLRAMPCYLDFGLFCINLGVAEKAGLLKPDETKWLEKLVAAADPKVRDHAVAPSGLEQRNAWTTLADRVPRCWANEEGPFWFAKPNPQAAETPDATVVDWMAKAAAVEQPAGVKSYTGFAFDLSTPEVAAVAFLELAWAFGAPEKVFSLEADMPSFESFDAGMPPAKTFRFLMYLVVEGLMPRQVSVTDAGVALFSRHFYSTLADIVEPQNHARSGVPGLIAIPFFPTGVSDKEALWQTLCYDIVERLERFVGVVRFALGNPAQKRDQTGNSVGATHGSGFFGQEFDALCQQVADAKEKLDSIWQKPTHQRSVDCEVIANRFGDWTRDFAEVAVKSLSHPHFQIGGSAEKPRVPSEKNFAGASDFSKYAPQARSLDCRDILEFSRRHKLRHDFFESVRTPNGAGVGTLLTSAGKRNSIDSRSSATGYSCTGSWMVGVQAKTHSAGLSCRLIDEITSLECAQERARRGAGMPARKDFYEFHGLHPVKHASYLQWNDLLRACGARARQRTRASEELVKVRDFNVIVGRQLRTCLQFAELHKQEYATADKDSRDELIKKMLQTSSVATYRILKELREAYNKEKREIEERKRARGNQA